MDARLVNINLSIEVKNDSMIANLRFLNDSIENIYLDTWAFFFDNKIRNNYFNIIDENNKEVKYVGMLAKRFISPKDFILFKPGEKINTSIVLNDVYRFVKGGKYKIKYFTFHPSSLDGPGIMKLESNTVETTY